VGLDTVGGIAIRYRQGGPRIQSRWGRDFSHSSIPALGPTQPPLQWEPGLFPGVKLSVRGVDYPPTSSADVKERVDEWVPVTTAWRVLRLRLEERSPDMKGSCEYIE
jgi:hypothetical protein